LAGASAVMIGTNLDIDRLNLAKDLGADGIVNADGVDNVVDAVEGILGAEGADLVIECSGAAPAAKTLIDVARRGARFCQIGLFGKPIPFHQDAVCYKELAVTGTNASVTPGWPKALKLLARSQIDVQRLITHRLAIADWDRALEVVKNKK